MQLTDAKPSRFFRENLPAENTDKPRPGRKRKQSPDQS
jgi:hypothetical protein